MATVNQIGLGLSGSTGTGSFVGSTAPTMTLPSINNVLNGYTTTATAAGITTLDVNSNFMQFFTGVTTQTVTMPVVSTLTLGQSFRITNNSTGVVTVQSSGGNTITAMAAGTSALITCILTSGTSAASWYSDYQSVGSPATVSQGGTGVTSLTAYALIAGGTTSTGPVQSLATGSAGQMLQSGGASALPAYSTATYPATTTINQLLYSSANNTVTGLATANDGVLVTGATGIPSISSTLPAAVLLNVPGRLKSFQIFTSGTAATYTRPAGIVSILVEVIGGGGGGGGVAAAASSAAAAGGGGGGGYARLWIAAASSSYTYTVGALGAGGAAGNNNGSAGGTTTFGASLQATGGSGGNGSPAVATTTGNCVAGGSAGQGSNGDFNTAGISGFQGFTYGGNAMGGPGGGTVYGGGGRGTASGGGYAAGNGGGNYGSGGSGACTGASTNRAGGDGAPGLIVVWEFS